MNGYTFNDDNNIHKTESYNIFDGKYDVLKKVYGFDSFRENQENIIDTIMNGEDILSIMSTGSGKSLCYQIPAILSSGITIVISPLISLMEDQIQKLRSYGIECAFINSTLSEGEYSRIKNEILNGVYQIIYVAPERLQSNDFRYISNKINISLVVVDEAHCVSQWGNDFRKAYLSIKSYVNSIKPRPVLAAFTATATLDVEDDIINMLGLINCKVVKGSFDRPNLYISKYNIPFRKKSSFVLDYLLNNKDKSGIIYCSTRKNVDELYRYLFSNGISVGKYHAGMSEEDRKISQDDFIYDRINVMVATNAFGMGIDKSNVNYVIHYNCPKDIESYYQEIGRAGRDGTKAECILLYNGQDFNISKYLIDKMYEEELVSNYSNFVEDLYQYKLKKLDDMKRLCYTNDCIRIYMLNYFGECKDEDCNNCSSCKSEYEQVDVTKECLSILLLVNELNGIFGETTLANTLKGSKSIKISSLGLDRSRYYGALHNLNISEIRELISTLVYHEYLFKNNSEYPTIALTDNGFKQINERSEKIWMKKMRKSETPKKLTDEMSNMDLMYFLKQLRLDLARKESIPAYLVFSDKTLINMCQILPVDMGEFLSVSGVGEYKAKKYGTQFIKVIKEYVDKYQK